MLTESCSVGFARCRTSEHSSAPSSRTQPDTPGSSGTRKRRKKRKNKKSEGIAKTGRTRFLSWKLEMCISLILSFPDLFWFKAPLLRFKDIWWHPSV